jgi:hypothetical protein
MFPKRITAWIVAGAVCASMALARNPGEPPKPGFNLFSKQQDIQLGQEASQQVRQQYQVVQNEFLQGYLRRVGDRLAATPIARQGGFNFNFTLLNVPEVNAFALPGGPMFVYSGLVKTADNESQLAGVMAHEMSHVILRHGTHEATKANFIQLPAMLAGAVVGNGSMLGQLAQLGIGLGANSVLLKFSRTAESEADALGAQMMAQAGYNPIEMARFFEKLQGSARGPQFLSDHPNPGNRMRAIQDEIRAMPQRSYSAETGDFQRAKQEIDRLPPPAKRGNLRSQATAPNENPSSSGWQQLRGQYFTVSHPGSWQVFGDRQSSMVTIAPRDGLVQAGNGTQVGYGAILSYFTPEGRSDLRSATDDLIHHLHAQNPSMQPTGNPRQVRVDNSSGLVTMMQSNSPYGGAETDALLTVGRPEGLFYMIFIAPSQNYSQLQSAFEQMLGSIRFSS